MPAVATVLAPSTAERVRSACVTAQGATLAVEGVPTTVTELHRLRESGDVVIALAERTPATALAWQAGLSGLPAVLELTDTTTIALREPVRALVWLRGRLQPVHDQRTLALEVSAELAHHALLGVGHGTVLLRLELESAVVADSTGAAPVGVTELLAARPDPFCADEATWLRHLEHTHADLLALMARRLPAHLRRGQVRALGLDRYGLRLRVEQAHGLGDADVRLPFHAPVDSDRALGRALRVLAGCPFRNGLQARTA